MRAAPVWRRSRPAVRAAVAYKKCTAVTIPCVVVYGPRLRYNLRFRWLIPFQLEAQGSPPLPPANVRGTCIYVSIRGASKIPRCYRRAQSSPTACTTRRVCASSLTRADYETTVASVERSKVIRFIIVVCLVTRTQYHRVPRYKLVFDIKSQSTTVRDMGVWKLQDVGSENRNGRGLCPLVESLTISCDLL